MTRSYRNLGRFTAAPDFPKFVQSIGGDKSPFPIPKTQSAFRWRAQRTAFHRRDGRQQSRSFALRDRQSQRSPNSMRLC
jgi:hypothetical protein